MNFGLKSNTEPNAHRLGLDMLAILLSVSIGFQAIGFEELPVAHVEQIAKTVMGQMAGELDLQPTLEISHREEKTPLGAIAYDSGECTLVINTNKDAWKQWGRFLNRDKKTQWDATIAASVAHEMGHCLRESRAFTSSYQIHRSSLNALGGSTANANNALVFKQELFADTVAILYAKEHLSQDAPDMVNTLIGARKKFGEHDPTHNTSRELTALTQQNDNARLAHETIGAAAMRLLSGL